MEKENTNFVGGYVITGDESTDKINNFKNYHKICLKTIYIISKYLFRKDIYIYIIKNIQKGLEFPPKCFEQICFPRELY